LQATYTDIVGLAKKYLAQSLSLLTLQVYRWGEQPPTLLPEYSSLYPDLIEVVLGLEPQDIL